jgi:hypothetical protein
MARGGAVWCDGGGRGKGEAARGEWAGALVRLVGRRSGAGTLGTAPGCGGAGGRRGRWKERGELEVGDEPDRWAPPVGGCVREKGREAGACGPAWAKSWRRGRNWAGVTGPRREKERGKRKEGGGLDRG